ncbi:hypothetical protein IJJ08_03645 [bacterium]|nr:hypothetical protein [bacterium]
MTMTNHYYAGGLTDLNPHPTPISAECWQRWLSLDEAWGKAWRDFLHWPAAQESSPLTQIVGDEWLLDIAAIDTAFWQHTGWQLIPGMTLDLSPQLQFNHQRLLTIHGWQAYHLVAKTRSRWRHDPPAAVTQAQQIMSGLPTTGTPPTAEKVIVSDILPRLIAVDLITQLMTARAYQQLPYQQHQYLTTYLRQEIAKKNWFFTSIIDLLKVRNRVWTPEQYLQEYGHRADRDFELTCPRWHELTAQEITTKASLMVTPQPSDDLNLDALHWRSRDKRVVMATIELHWLRLEMLKSLSQFFDLYRQWWLQTAPADLEVVTNYQYPPATHIDGAGISLYPGQVEGRVLNIARQRPLPPDTIGIFPDGSLEFAPLVSQCRGLIIGRAYWLSPLVLLAQHYQIPTISDRQALGLPVGATIVVDADRGHWHLQ